MSEEKYMNYFSGKIEEAIKDKLEGIKSEEELKRFKEKIESDDFQKMLLDFFECSSVITVQGLKETMHEEIVHFRAQEKEFIARLEQKWCDAFVASEAMYIMVTEIAEMYQDYIKTLDENKKKKKEWEYIALMYIHARSIQVYLEIVTLIRNGFADGAFSRWRTMYELAIVASFIQKYGEDVAKAYVESSNTDDRYDWAKASRAFSESKKHICFSDIQKESDYYSTEWKKQYDLANKTVHASSQGTFNRLGILENGKNIIPIGRTDYGLTIPAEHAAISLAHISVMFFSIFSNSDVMVYTKSLLKWIDVVREIYFKTHDDVFPDDTPLWHDEIPNNHKTEDKE